MPVWAGKPNSRARVLYNQPMRWLENLINYILCFVILLLIPTSSPRLTSIYEQVNVLVSSQAFDAITWTLKATWVKLEQSAMGSPRYFDASAQHNLVLEYINVVKKAEKTQDDIDLIYANPSIKDPEAESTELRKQLAELTRQQDEIGPFAEAILEQQVTNVLADLGFTSGGQPRPWVLYHITPLPQYLVISPRDHIEQITSYLLQPSLTIEQIEGIENHVAAKLNVSTLITPVGGLAAYPTMIMRTTSLSWLTDTIAHEWIHIYLIQRPLGLSYEDPQVRTMNETTASIAGGEIGKIVMERYYPELAHEVDPALQLASLDLGPLGPWNFPPPFDFRREMHTTRITADQLLAQGKIDEAEAYMDERRQLFWAHGYTLRKLNQAYFAFHGAYADQPGGAAGEDPVGPAVRKLREKSGSLLEFIEKISQMSSFDELQQAIGEQTISGNQ